MNEPKDDDRKAHGSKCKKRLILYDAVVGLSGGVGVL